jgi:predicted restriction endonuclease
MAFSKKVKERLKKDGRFKCCEMCGFQMPRLENCGLQAAHIVSEKDGGPDSADNSLVLCNNCADSFDRFIKPVLFKALALMDIKAPTGWEKSEGRRARGDSI